MTAGEARERAEPIGAESDPRPGAILALWMALMVVLQAAAWASGARGTGLTSAIEAGAARAESRGIGEVGDEVVRKAIALQHDTRPFWATVAALGDFGAEPLGLAVRAATVATFFAGLALLKGRPVGFSAGFAGCAWAQGFWVLGLAVRVALAIALKRPEAETSAALLLPPGMHPATTWLAMRQVDAFALLGWFALALGGWRRGQVGPISAFGVVFALFSVEAIARLSFAILIESGMRLSLLATV